MKLFIAMETSPDCLHQLARIPGLELELPQSPCGTDYAIPEELAGQIDILLCEHAPRNLNRMGALKLLQLGSTGYSQLFGLPLSERGIRVCNARGVFDVPIAEWAIAMMVNLQRDLRTMIRHQDAGVWDRSPRFQTELRGKTLGLFGYGSLARETARLAKAMGMRIHAYSRRRDDYSQRNYYAVPGTGDPQCLLPDEFYLPGQEAEFFSQLDFLAVAMPLTKRTEGILTADWLNLLPEGAFLLNFARGPLIPEQALLDALRSGHLGGAALDAHYAYPLPPDHPLWRFPNVILTPHISGSSKSTNFLPRIYDICAQNVVRLQNGAPLLNELSPSQLAGD